MITESKERLIDEMIAWYRQQRSTPTTRDPFRRARVLQQGAQDLRRVRMIQTGGSNGNATQENTWEYRVESLGGDVLATGLRVNRDSIHDYWTQELGEVDPATMGLAYHENDNLIIHYCNEHFRVGPCDSEGEPVYSPTSEGNSRWYDIGLDVKDCCDALLRVRVKKPDALDVVEINVAVDGEHVKNDTFTSTDTYSLMVSTGEKIVVQLKQQTPTVIIGTQFQTSEQTIDIDETEATFIFTK